MKKNQKIKREFTERRSASIPGNIGSEFLYSGYYYLAFRSGTVGLVCLLIWIFKFKIGFIKGVDGLKLNCFKLIFD